MNNLESLIGKVEFISVPNNMFYVKGNAGYFVELKDYNMIPILIYIQTKKDILNEIRFSIADAIEYCGLKPTKGKGKSIDKMKQLFNKLKNEEIINCEVDFDSVKINDFIKATYNPIAVQGNSFTKIPIHVINKIMKSNYDDKRIALTLWSYIHCRRYKKNTIGEGKESATQVSYKTITRDTGLSNDTINKYFDIMVKDEILLIHNSGYLIKKNEKPVSANNIYVTVDGDLELAKGFMHEAISRYEHERRQEGYKISKCSPEKKKSKKERKVQEEPNDENRQEVEPEVEQELLEEVPVVEPVKEELTAIDVVKIGEIVFKYYEEDLVIEYKSNKLIGFGGEESIFEDVKKNVKISLDAIGYARTEEERNKYKLEAELWQEIYNTINGITEEDIKKIEEEQNKKIGVLT